MGSDEPDMANPGLDWREEERGCKGKRGREGSEGWRSGAGILELMGPDEPDPGGGRGLEEEGARGVT